MKAPNPLAGKLKIVLLGAVFLVGAVDVLGIELPWALADQPGDCGYYSNSPAHTVSRPCGNSRTDAPPPASRAYMPRSDL